MRTSSILLLSLSIALGANTAVAKPVNCTDDIHHEHGTGHHLKFLYWPVSDQKGNPYGRSYVSQDFAQYWHHTLNGFDQYHDAFDIAPGVTDAQAVAVADGYVVALIPNGKSGCVQPNCTDHGFGNTLILYSGQSIENTYTLYAHLASFDQTIMDNVRAHCGPPVTGIVYHIVRYEYDCPSTGQNMVHVTATQPLGIVGGTCFGQSNCPGGINLHFEVRGFTDLVSHKADVKNKDGFSYSECYPTEVKYKKPVNFFDNVTHIPVPFKVTVTTDGNGKGLHFGPNQEYTRPLSASTDTTYWVPRQSAGPTTNCSHGWDDVTQQPDSKWPGDPTKYFYLYTDTVNDKPVKNFAPDLWICKGNKDATGDHDYVEPQ